MQFCVTVQWHAVFFLFFFLLLFFEQTKNRFGCRSRARHVEERISIRPNYQEHVKVLQNRTWFKTRRVFKSYCDRNNPNYMILWRGKNPARLLQTLSFLNWVCRFCPEYETIKYQTSIFYFILLSPQKKINNCQHIKLILVVNMKTDVLAIWSQLLCRHLAGMNLLEEGIFHSFAHIIGWSCNHRCWRSHCPHS